MDFSGPDYKERVRSDEVGCASVMKVASASGDQADQPFFMPVWRVGMAKRSADAELN